LVNGSVPLPVTFTSILGKLVNGKADINWGVANETAGSIYAVEKSTNGTAFTTIATVRSIGASAYTAVDSNPIAGINYYRIKAVSAAGAVLYSKTITLVPDDLIANNVRIYPTIVTSNKLNIQFSNMEVGNYQLVVYNVLGQTVATKTIVNPLINATTQTDLGSSKPAAGTYNAQLLKGGKLITMVKLVVE
jgi:hypothetical protein